MLFKRSSNSRKALQEKIKTLEKRLKLATTYLNKISEGQNEIDFTQHFEKQTDEEGQIFQSVLLKTKEKLTDYTRLERERIWVAEGMAKFMDVIQGDRTRENFYDVVLTMIIRYTGAIQGGVFMLNEIDPQDPHLELKACYAYGRKKFVEKKVGLGQGMLGQCFLEKETNIYTTVPSNYFDITSGLGEATPRYLIIVPLKYDQQVMGVIELASFHSLEKYKVEFIEKIAENLASVALNIQHASRATILYEESQMKARRLQEQEENLRQNIEELESTQEEMKRHQQELDQRTHLMKFIIDNIPFPIFVKDERGRYMLVNQSEAKLFNLKDTELIGKDDSFFVSNDEEWKVIQESDERVLASEKPLELPIQHFTTAMGASYVFKTTKIPFVNNMTGKKNILGVSIDLTEKLDLEKKLLFERSINSMNTLVNLAGRQRMLSQKIGFYAEMIVRGKLEQIPELKSVVDLFEHSLQVIKGGGMPIGINCENPLPEADLSLIPHIQSIEKVWRPYKESARKILYYLTFKDSNTADAKGYEIDTGITFIEENAETLLDLNNDLMLACIALNEERVSVDADMS
jgi:PAS domain S-box-containing protein